MPIVGGWRAGQAGSYHDDDFVGVQRVWAAEVDRVTQERDAARQRLAIANKDNMRLEIERDKLAAEVRALKRRLALPV